MWRLPQFSEGRSQPQLLKLSMFLSNEGPHRLLITWVWSVLTYSYPKPRSVS